jgi:hypothetical protein
MVSTNTQIKVHLLRDSTMYACVYDNLKGTQTSVSNTFGFGVHLTEWKDTHVGDSQQTPHERGDYTTQVRHKMEISIPTS